MVDIFRKSYIEMAVVVAVVVAVFVGVTPARADEEADALIRSMEDRTRAETNTATYRMVVTRPGEGDREVVMQSWDDRVGDRSFIHILLPRRDKDTTFLKVEGNLWMYLPNLERDIKIPPAMMLNSWMGSDFTNDDLVNQSSAVNDYNNTILARETGADGIEVVTIQAVAHLDAPVVWGRVVMQVRMDGIPIIQKFYDEGDVLIRSLIFSNIQDMGGRLAPGKMEMIPETEPGHRTVMFIEDMTFDEPIAEDIFTRANLSRRAR
jgi:hypothetical protein